MTQLIPIRGCTCGFYATHRDFPTDYFGPIEGSIKAEGRVIIGEIGLRAQYATIEALCLTRNRVPVFAGLNVWSNIRKRIEEYYQVPILPDRGTLLKEFPPQDISNLVDLPSRGRAADLHTLPAAGVIINFLTGETIIVDHGKVRITTNKFSRPDLDTYWISSTPQWYELYRQAVTSIGVEFDQGPFGG
jgi:hypothetical protein